MSLIGAFPISFLFGDLCCAFAPCRKDSIEAGCNAQTVIFTLFHKGLWIGTVNESIPNVSIILQTFVLIGLMLVSGARVEDDIFNVQFYCLSLPTNVHIVQTHEQGMWDISYALYNAFKNVMPDESTDNWIMACRSSYKVDSSCPVTRRALSWNNNLDLTMPCHYCK